jgi:hypothetical protein
MPKCLVLGSGEQVLKRFRSSTKQQSPKNVRISSSCSLTPF